MALYIVAAETTFSNRLFHGIILLEKLYLRVYRIESEIGKECRWTLS